jgi:hypothetical protein
LAYAIALVTIVIAVVFVLVRKVEITIYSGTGRVAAIKYVVLAIIPLAVTIAFNFNAIYPALMREYLLREELAEKRIALQTALGEAQKQLSDSTLEAWRGRLDALVGQMESQINSPNAPGAGQRTEEILRSIEQELGQKLTRHKSNPRVAREINERYKDDINKLRNNNPKQIANREKEIDLVKIKQMVNDALTKMNVASKALEEGKGGAGETVLVALNNASVIYEDVVVRTQHYVPNAFSAEAKKLRVLNAEIGKLAHTVESAQAHLHVGATWWALFAAFLIDMWAIFLALLYTSPAVSKSVSTHEASGARVHKMYRLQ